MHGVPVKRFYSPEALQVGLHAAKVKQAHTVISRACQYSGTAVVHIQGRHILALACSSHQKCEHHT